MATRTYTRGNLADMRPDQLAAEIDAALTRPGHAVEIEGTAVRVTHAALSAADDTTVDATIAAYTFNPTFGVPTERLNLRGKVAILRQWTTEGEAVFGASGSWDGLTTAQRFAVVKVMGDRLTKFFDNFADLLQAQGLNE